MKVLGLDTSTSCGSVGLVKNGEVISEYILNVPATHSQRILAAIELVLQESCCPIEQIDTWSIALGPGSFTGLRIGVSTIKGLAFATGKPVTGVSTLDVLASQISPAPYLICPLLDARKQEVYAAFYRFEKNTMNRLSDYQAIKPEDLVKSIKEQTIFVGEGAKNYREFLLKSLSSLALFPPAPFHLAHGSVVAKLGFELLEKGESLDLSTFAPIYVRPSEAEIKWQEKYSA